MNKIIHRLLKKGAVDRGAQTEGKYELVKEGVKDKDRDDKALKNGDSKDVRSSMDSISMNGRPMSGGHNASEPNQPLDNNLSV